MIIYNAKIYTMAGSVIENGYVVSQNGKITEIGSMADFNKQISESDIDGKNMNLYPGFVDAHSHIGVWENGLGFEGDDGNEETDPNTPNLRAIDMINPMDYCFTEAMEAGITTVISGMGSANAIGGSFLAMKTFGSPRIDKRIVKCPVAIKFALGENPKTVYSDKDLAPITRMATVAIIREQLQKTKNYKKDLDDYKKSIGTEDELDIPDFDAKSEALLPLFERKIKAHIHCHRADDIFTAIRICKEFDLEYVIIHGTEGHFIADELAEENCPVIAGPVICDRSKPEIKNHTIKSGAGLFEKNIKLAICTDHPVVPEQYLPLSAGLAVRGGLPEEEAIKAITINAAEICDISHRVGSIEVGKDADFVLVKGNPLEVMTTPELVICDGIISYRKA